MKFARDKVRVGLLGAGYIADAHAKALSQQTGIEKVAVCDLSIARARHLATAHGFALACDTIEDLLAADCDVVHVLVPPDLHAAMCRRILEAGIDVFVEKPMGLDAEACRDLARLATERGAKLGVNHNFLFLPAYEQLRARVRAQATGRLDHIALNWLYTLRLLQFGPYSNWILAKPENLFFEVGSHIAAFAVDLAGPPDHVRAVASQPVDLPGNQRVYRHWSAVLSCAHVTCTINLSVAPGETDRSVIVRGLAEAVRVDLERNSCVVEKSRSNSILFDNVAGGWRGARQLLSASLDNFRRYAIETLRRRGGGNPFEESIGRSIDCFYRTRRGPELDQRLDGYFGAQVIALCQQVVAEAAPALAERPDIVRRALATARLPGTAPELALVVGGTGFIGKRLVQRLLADGHRVRVLSRSRANAVIELAGLDVQVIAGSHGNQSVLDEALEGVDVVFHLARTAGDRWGDYVAGDIEPTRMLGEAAARHGVRRFIYTGTIDSYDSSRSTTTIDCSTPVDPGIRHRNHYARSKAACEALLTDLSETRGLPLVILRPGIVIGEGSPPAHWGVGMFHSDTRVQYWGDGSNKLPFVLVDDVAEALARAAYVPGIEGRTLLVTGPPVMSAREYVKALELRSGTSIQSDATPVAEFFLQDVFNQAVKRLIRHPKYRRATYRDWASRAHLATYDSSETEKLLGWQPASEARELVERGIDPAVDHYFGVESAQRSAARPANVHVVREEMEITLGVVVIGRNEGERLRRCLASLQARRCTVVYVDSGSLDDSPMLAAQLGAEVLHLDLDRPFTAARARNAGLLHLIERKPSVRYVQFIDGDCEIVPAWLDSGLAFLSGNPGVGAVCGRRRERFPDASLYNHVCELEWNTRVGATRFTGGDVMMRIDALLAVGGWRESLIAGEEPELCLRLRTAGWDIWRLDADMTLHDAAMHRFMQWWQRSTRAGHAYAEGAFLHGSAPEHHYVRESRRAWVWAALLPAAALVGYAVIGPAALLLLLAYPLQFLRLVTRERGSIARRFGTALLGVLGKFPELLGQLRYHWNRLAGRTSMIIEYK